ncbi:MAG TPA: large conductance mechanosensitive channel protein MscL [Mycobacteriales bacterium]
MLKGFRDFIMRGNVLELAVAVAIGTAFTAVVMQFGESFIKPLVAVFAGGGEAGGTFTVQGQKFDYGAFVNAVIFFLITAAVIYLFVVVPYNAFEERRKRGQGPVDPPAPSDDIVLLTEIRDLLREQQPNRGL